MTCPPFNDARNGTRNPYEPTCTDSCFYLGVHDGRDLPKRGCRPKPRAPARALKRAPHVRVDFGQLKHAVETSKPVPHARSMQQSWRLVQALIVQACADPLYEG